MTLLSADNDLDFGLVYEVGVVVTKAVVDESPKLVLRCYRANIVGIAFY